MLHMTSIESSVIGRHQNLSYYLAALFAQTKKGSFQTMAWPVGFETADCRDRLGNGKGALIDGKEGPNALPSQ